LKTDHDGFPIGFDLTGGEASDSTHFKTLMELGPDIRPRAIVADKGYDSAANRASARARGAVPVIPFRKNTKAIPKVFAKALYRGRARIEQMIGKLKRFKRIALRCEKTKRNFSSFVALAAAFILIKSVHTA
jgi:transposase